MSKLLSIPKKDYLALLGIKTLADKKISELKELENAAAGILDVPEDEGAGEYYGHVSDCLIGQMCSIKQLLNRLDIEVKDLPETENPDQ